MPPLTHETQFTRLVDADVHARELRPHPRTAWACACAVRFPSLLYVLAVSAATLCIADRAPRRECFRTEDALEWKVRRSAARPCSPCDVRPRAYREQEVVCPCTERGVLYVWCLLTRARRVDAMCARQATAPGAHAEWGTADPAARVTYVVTGPMRDRFSRAERREAHRTSAIGRARTTPAVPTLSSRTTFLLARISYYKNIFHT